MGLEIEDLWKSYPGQTVLRGVNFAVDAGEIHALVGANGSGKSTLMRFIVGNEYPDRVAVAKLDDRPLVLGSEAAAYAAGIRCVYQDLGLISTFTVRENFFLSGLGHEHRFRIPTRLERKVVHNALGELGLDLDPDRVVATLPLAERVMVGVTRALLGWHDGTVKILLLDEPTAALPGPDASRLLDIVREVAKLGVGVVFVSHRSSEVLGLADKVTVLRDGVCVGTGLRGDEVTEAELARLMVGSQASDEGGAQVVGGVVGRPNDAVVFGARGFSSEICDDISFEAYGGEILGLAGLTGCGREELCAAAAGISGSWSGDFFLGGERLPHGSVRAAISMGVVRVPADRLIDGLIKDATITENILLPQMHRYRRRGFRVDSRKLHGHVTTWLETLHVTPPEPHRKISTLSGGNQQKVVLAKWLHGEPRVLILDEPTAGVDVIAKRHIHEFLRMLAANGVVVIVSSNDYEEVVGLCTRVLVINHGRIGAELFPPAITVERIVFEASRTQAVADAS